jgi:hypothetical protein
MTRERWKDLFEAAEACLAIAAMAGLAFSPTAHAEEEPEPIKVGPVELTQIHHDQNLLPDRGHSGFGALLYDADGRLVMDGDRTWLYTTGLFEAPEPGKRDWYGKWVSHVRDFDPRNFMSGEPKLALGLYGEDKWAVIHTALKVSDDLYVVFYSANGLVRAATSPRPDGVFRPDPEFSLAVTEAWEGEGGEKDSLESTGGFCKIAGTDEALEIALLYDSYHVDQTRGDLGWANVRIDKATGDVELVGKDPDGALPLRPEGYIAARAGGNLGSDVMLGGKHVMFYYLRPSKEVITLTAALSDDPSFREVDEIAEVGPVQGDEQVIEKFQSYMIDDLLHVIYENKLASGHWGTGIRLYEVDAPKAVIGLN